MVKNHRATPNLTTGFISPSCHSFLPLANREVSQTAVSLLNNFDYTSEEVQVLCTEQMMSCGITVESRPSGCLYIQAPILQLRTKLLHCQGREISASKGKFWTPHWSRRLVPVSVTSPGCPYEPIELEQDGVVYSKCQVVVLERKKSSRQTAFWHLSLLGFATLQSSNLVFKIENTVGIYFPSVLVSKPVLDMPRAGRLSAITATTDTCGVENCLLLWDLHQPGHIQRERCCGMQELCPACRQVRLRSTGVFS